MEAVCPLGICNGSGFVEAGEFDAKVEKYCVCAKDEKE